MRDLFILSVTFALFALGFRAPFVFGLGYIWTDYFTPQKLGFAFLSNIPFSLLFALAAGIGYLVVPKREQQRFVPTLWLLVVWAVWVTMTTLWAEVPAEAWSKWDWAFKTICFAAFIPFLFRTRVQLEAMLLTIALAVGATLFAFG